VFMRTFEDLKRSKVRRPEEDKMCLPAPVF
jgi:hypothetical protein